MKDIEIKKALDARMNTLNVFSKKNFLSANLPTPEYVTNGPFSIGDTQIEITASEGVIEKGWFVYFGKDKNHLYEVKEKLVDNTLVLVTALEKDVSDLTAVHVLATSKFTNICYRDNTFFSEPEDKRYFIVSTVFDTPETIGMYETGLERYYGFYQIDICTPKGKGTDEADSKFTWISKLFADGTSFDGIDVEKVYRAETIEEEDLFRTIIRVNFNADIDNKE